MSDHYRDEKGKKVTFIRKNGRVIPIRKKPGAGGPPQKGGRGRASNKQAGKLSESFRRHKIRKDVYRSMEKTRQGTFLAVGAASLAFGAAALIRSPGASRAALNLMKGSRVGSTTRRALNFQRNVRTLKHSAHAGVQLGLERYISKNRRKKK